MTKNNEDSLSDEDNAIAITNHTDDLTVKMMIDLATSMPSQTLKIPSALKAVLNGANHTNPADPVEALLLTQMLTCHEHALDMLRKSTKASFGEAAQTWLKLANSLMATYTKQLEVLARYQRGATQKVIVEHVTVEAGGQAAIGNISGGGGASR